MKLLMRIRPNSILYKLELKFSTFNYLLYTNLGFLKVLEFFNIERDFRNSTWRWNQSENMNFGMYFIIFELSDCPWYSENSLFFDKRKDTQKVLPA